MLQTHAAARGFTLEIFYTHIEGDAIGRIYEAVDSGVDAIVMNPAGFLFGGYALRECLKGLRLPVIEVHMSNIEKRGMHSVTAEAVHGVIAGFGLRSYTVGLDLAAELAAEREHAST